ncbi:MAG: carboxypeptidase regulatory-like domain-containing protein, partial [Prevotella sp.]|nr:carboxypeptidase regulatory-like domain-containing protein [Prevotella sp.]
MNKTLRFSLLSLLMLLCGTLFAQKQETLTPSTASGYSELTVTEAGTSGTGSATKVSKGDIVVTSDIGYIKDHEMTVYKNGTMTVAFKEGVNAHITKVELVVKNYHFAKPEGWTAEYSNDVTAKINTDETETFTTDATDVTSFVISNASPGKTTVKAITVYYEENGGGAGAAYLADFNTAISTSNHDFAVASNWGHIVPNSDYDGYGPYYMSYSYSSTSGIDGSGTLLAYRQYAGDYGGGEVVYDLLVTPNVQGTIQLFVQASGLASSSNPSFVEFYTLNAAGNGRGELIQRFTADDYVASEIEGWSTVSINVATMQRIAIRAQYVYLDNFSATAAEIVKEKKLTIKGVSSPTGQTPYYVNQNADGSADVQLVVKLQNSGEVDFVAGQTENYTLSPVKKAYYGSTETVYDAITFDIPENLAVGEEKDVTMTFNVPAIETGWLYWKVKENISSTVSSAQVQSQVQEYASKFIFDVAGSTYYSSSSATSKPINLGKITETTTVNYEIYNSGSAPLTINSFAVPAGYTTDAPEGEFVVAAGEKKQIAITLSAENYGIFAGNIEIVYTNFGKAQATYILAISGTVVDPSKNLITFDNGETGEALNGQFPKGSIHSDQVYITSATEGDVTNYFLQSTSTTTKFVTPLLTAQAGESFTYDAWYSGWSGSSSAVTVYTSTDRVNWTQADRQTYSSGIGSTPTTFNVTIAEAGNYYLAFELAGNALLDNIYGLTLAESPLHDWYLMGSNVPAAGKQNKAYTASISLKNIDSMADEVISATLFVDGEAVQVLNNVELPANDKTAAVGTGRNGYSNIEEPTVISFTFIPHKIGTLPVYIELKSGQTAVTSETVDVTFAEEKLESDIAVGNSKSTSQYAPFYSSWMDDSSGNSMSDMLYTPEQLAAFGIKSGDKIVGITFRGTPTGSKTINSLSADAWVAMQEVGSFVAGTPDKDNMTHASILNEQETVFESGTAFDFAIDLSASPIVYDGASAIRVFTNINGHGQYQNIAFPTDTEYNNAYYAHGATPSWSSAYGIPVAYFSLDVEPTFYTGTVTDGTDPVAGAVVTLTSADEDDVQYTGTTTTDGTFQIAIIQDTKTYNVSVEAEGYPEAAAAEGVTFPAEPATFVLLKPAGYVVDFNTEITTANHDFRVASGWKHIADKYNDGYSDYYMTYSYQPEGGIDGTGALQANRQFAGDNWDNKTTYDLLVTPLVQGQVKLNVKPTTTASSSNPAFVEFYTLNADGTARETLIQRFADLASGEWTPVAINVANEQRIGIRAQYVVMDDFSATVANIVPEPALTIISVKDVNDANTTYFDAKEDGSYTIEYKVVVKNTGDLDLVAGTTENYSLSVFDRYATATKYGEFAIPFNLAVGQTSEEFVMSIDIPAGQLQGWKYRDVIENVSNSTAAGRWSNVNAYEPKFVFAAVDGTSSLYGDIAFGKISEDSTQTFDIYNDGTAPLQVKSITAPAGFTLSETAAFTLAKKERKTISITLPATTPGIYSGNLEIVYVDAAGADQTFTKAVTGTVLDVEKNIIIFSDAEGNAAYPAGSVRYGVYISGDSDNRYLQGTNTNPLYITPLMTAKAGEQIAFDAEYTSWSSSSVVVKTSTDRQNWTTIATISDIASSYNWTTYTATIAEAGNYYIGFELNNARLDNIYGLVYAPVADHDWLLIKSEVPAAGTQNALYTATAALGNVGPNAEAADAYTATLFVGGEAVATVPAVELPVAEISGNYNNADESNYTAFSFSFRPHTIGTLPAYIEFKAGDYALTTPVVDVTFAEEVLMSELQIGSRNGSSQSVPFYSTWMDESTGNSMADFAYSPEQLAAFGLKQGDKITGIKFVGTPTGSKDIASLTVDAWIAQESADAAMVAGEVDKDQMTHVTVFDAAQSFQSGEPVDFSIDLSAAPLVYDGTSRIRVYTNINGHGQYQNITFDVDNNYSTAFYARGTTPSWSSAYTPVAYFSLAVEPTYLTGTVTDGQDKVAGAQLLLVSTDGDDIQYAATTDAEGLYSINVIQAQRDYQLTVTAEGFQTAKAKVEMAGQSQTLDVVLYPESVSEELAKSLLSIDPADGSKVKSLQTFRLKMNDGTGVQDVVETNDGTILPGNVGNGAVIKVAAKAAAKGATLTNTTTGTVYEMGITTSGIDGLVF